jgi:hypothetical protein
MAPISEHDAHPGYAHVTVALVVACAVNILQ